MARIAGVSKLRILPRSGIREGSQESQRDTRPGSKERGTPEGSLFLLFFAFFQKVEKEVHEAEGANGAGARDREGAILPKGETV
jgi:hypothetical protein